VHDQNGVLVHATSTLTLDNGATLSRFGKPLSPFVDNSDGSSTANVQFIFSAAPSSTDTAPFGSFSQGLNGFTTVGNVSLTTDLDGRTAILLTESSPSAISTSATIPDGSSLLILDYRWPDAFTTLEHAVLSVDFVDENQTTNLFQSFSSEQDAHSGEFLRTVIPIAATLRNQKGAIRFLLTPSDSDGLLSRVTLGGFNIVSVPEATCTPHINAPQSLTVMSGAGATSCSVVVSDVVLGVATQTSNCPGLDIIRAGVPPNNIFPVGTTNITYTATEAGGNTATSTQTVTVVDNTAPSIGSVSVDPPELWPANHKMVDVSVNYIATDNCGAVTTAISSVASNEPTRDDDMVIVNSHLVRLRAERLGKGDGRIYTIRITAVDSHGNSSSQNVIVRVLHNQ
jgi:hypothetical protein